jgi:hypothetical protein
MGLKVLSFLCEVNSIRKFINVSGSSPSGMRGLRQEGFYIRNWKMTQQIPRRHLQNTSFRELHAVRQEQVGLWQLS